MSIDYRYCPECGKLMIGKEKCPDCGKKTLKVEINE